MGAALGESGVGYEDFGAGLRGERRGGDDILTVWCFGQQATQNNNNNEIYTKVRSA